MTTPTPDPDPEAPEWIDAPKAARMLRLGALDSDDLAVLEDWIGVVVGDIATQRPNTHLHIADGRLQLSTVQGVIVTALGRIFTAIDAGIGTKAEQHPEWSTTVDTAVARGDVLTKSELERLTPKPMSAARGIHSLPIGGQPGLYR